MGEGQNQPQQPEIGRSGRGKVDPDQPKMKQDVWGPGSEEGATGPVPEGNRPGHHPPKEQDKPGGGSPEPREARDRPH